MNRKSLMWTAAAAMAAAGLLAWAFWPRALEVETAAAARTPFEQAIEEDGRARLRDRYTVSAPVAARLARIALREGDRVQAGDTVAVLTPVMSALHDGRSQQEAQARLQAAQAQIAVASARMERARLAQEEARLEQRRNERLAADGYVSPARLDASRLALDGARRELEAAQAAREVAVQDRAQAAAATQPPGSGAGRPLALRAPVAGVVLRVPLPSEGTVAAGTALLEIGEPALMEVVADLLTTDAVAATPGTRAVIERWGGPPLEGRVRRVEPAAFTKVSALGIEEQRVRVLIDLGVAPPAWGAMGDGFRVSVRVVTARQEDAVTVPVGALFPHGDGGMAVYRVEGGRARLQPVEIGGRNGAEGWVRAGLDAGQQVVVYPPPGVRDGARVRMRSP